MGVYQNFQARHLPYGVWVCADETVTVFNRLYAPMFKFTPKTGVVRIDGAVDSSVPDDCVAEILFRFDGTFHYGSPWYNTDRAENIERTMLEWSVAAQATRLDEHEGRRLRRPYLPPSVRRYLSPDIQGRAVGIALRIGGDAEPTDKFQEYVVKRKAPPHPKGSQKRQRPTRRQNSQQPSA